ncbi:dihydrofolate reductase [Pontibacter ummariensis]|uniref:Dihydrofolate reductase n=1 Tax=Pontibacter ummariensis TaxID=1610492 RepID=A0A239EXI3_9BACT|nr:dihydrofolate reductase [Pontibacter ummariensis]PRY12699.1 dihydrofolate reductase [Pontibacter ummariensis]SNS49297.1 dihydrofolate reductase [Pontibacter ummariensis]
MVSIVVAAAENNAIGKNNDLIWYLPADLKHFKRLTMGHPILMGRKTYESIGKPLPGRTSIIITSQEDYKATGCIVVHSVEEAIQKGKALDEDICIIGGANIYKQSLHLADTVYLTRVHGIFEGDVFFPDLKDQDWKVVEQEHHEPDDKNKYSYTFLTLKRK